jgi:alpha-tubulin suppressor-like RCC1 family protein
MINTSTSRVAYVAGGATTEFAVPFYFLDVTHIEVVVTDTAGVESTKVLNTDFIVSGAGSPSGGTVTFTAAPTAGHTVAILRNVPMTQLVDYVSGDNFPAETHEQALDKLTMIAQYLYDLLQRSLKYPTSETNTANYILPAAVARQNTLLGYDAAGNMVLMALDAGALTLIAPVNVGTAQLVNGAVTADKLAAVLDLSTKTITLPAGSVTASMLAATLDLSGKTLTLPNSSVKWNNIAARHIISDIIQNFLAVSGLIVNNTTYAIIPSGAGSGAINGVTFSYFDVFNTKNRYRNPGNTIEIRWNSGNNRWEIYHISLAAVLYYSTDNVSTPDQARTWAITSGLAPTPTLTPSAEKLDVIGNIKASGYFMGDGSQLTSVPPSLYEAITTLPDMKGGCQRVSDRAFYIINGHGSVMACGLNTNGKLGIGSTAASEVMRRSYFTVGADAIDGVTDNRNNGTDAIVKVVLCANNAFALTASGILYAAGVNGSGQCGQGNTTQCTVFKAIRFGASSSTNKKIISFSAADGIGNAIHVLAIDEDGQVWLWGENAHGQLGINNTTNQTRPVKLSISTATNAATFVGKVASQVLAIAGDRGSSYIRFNDGTVYSAGRNQQGQLGIGSTTDAVNFTQIGAVTTAVELYGGGDYASGSTTAFGNLYIRLSDNTILACGSNASGQCGVGSTTNQTSPTAITGLGAVSQFYVMGDRDKWCLAVKLDGTIKVWGENSLGQLGDSSTTDRTSIVSPTGIDAIATAEGGVKKVTGYGNTTSAGTAILFNSGKVYVTGKNSSGQIGNGSTTDATVFSYSGLSATDNSDIAVVGSDDKSALVVRRTNNTAYACGSNGSNQLSIGDDTTGDVIVPTRVRP